MFKDHVEVPGLDKEKSKLDDLINQMRYFKDFIKKLNRMDVTSNRSQHQIKNGDIVLTYLAVLPEYKQPQRWKNCLYRQ